MYEFYVSVQSPDYRLVKRKSAPLPSRARPDAWQLLTECSDVSDLIREHCERHSFYISAEPFPLESELAGCS